MTIIYLIYQTNIELLQKRHLVGDSEASGQMKMKLCLLDTAIPYHIDFIPYHIDFD